VLLPPPPAAAPAPPALTAATPAAIVPALLIVPLLVTLTAPPWPDPEVEPNELPESRPITEPAPPLTARMPKDCTPEVGDAAFPVVIAPLLTTVTEPELPS